MEVARLQSRFPARLVRDLLHEADAVDHHHAGEPAVVKEHVGALANHHQREVVVLGVSHERAHCGLVARRGGEPRRPAYLPRAQLRQRLFRLQHKPAPKPVDRYLGGGRRLLGEARGWLQGRCGRGRGLGVVARGSPLVGGVLLLSSARLGSQRLRCGCARSHQHFHAISVHRGTDRRCGNEYSGYEFWLMTLLGMTPMS
mmetsp:Transcript_33607/g.63196  ORF Transcript_33607/g.63196 Transcript_33607/m.63196 type:complete len:200 (+) Transcript_33607:1079-1678(+)